MENNLENKTKFFAQYYGQEVKRSYLPEQTSLQVIDRDVFWIGHLIINGYLELKALEDITDEDALHIATSMYTAISDYQTISNGKCMDSCHENQIGLGMLQSDYLRSKGYALPWMGLSVEKLIEYGWVKLKEK